MISNCTGRLKDLLKQIRCGLRAAHISSSTSADTGVNDDRISQVTVNVLYNGKVAAVQAIGDAEQRAQHFDDAAVRGMALTWRCDRNQAAHGDDSVRCWR